MCTISTALMASERERSVSSLLLVLDLQCCLAPLLDLLPTNSEHPFQSFESFEYILILTIIFIQLGVVRELLSPTALPIFSVVSPNILPSTRF